MKPTTKKPKKPLPLYADPVEHLTFTATKTYAPFGLSVSVAPKSERALKQATKRKAQAERPKTGKRGDVLPFGKKSE